MVGSSGSIFTTADGGANFGTQTSGTLKALSGIWFGSATNGIIVGADGVILNTTNGGTDWAIRVSGTANSLNKVLMLDNSHAYADADADADGSGVLKTVDGGETWTLSHPGTAIKRVFFSDVNTGTAVGSSGNIYRTTDACANWTEQTSSTVQDLYGVYFVDENVGVAVGDGGLVVTTTDASLPVELASFSATSKTAAVNLSWITSSEIENLGFIIERRISSSQAESRDKTWITIATYKTNPVLEGQSSTTRETNYVYSDKDVDVGVSYDYRLSDVDYQGQVTTHDAISILVKTDDLDLRPGSFSVKSVYSNPFNPDITLSYSLTREMSLSVTILDIKGREIASLHNHQAVAGEHHLSWNGSNNSGIQMNSGLYFFNIQGLGFNQAIKIVKLD